MKSSSRHATGAAFACRPDASSASAVTRAHRSATSIYGMRVTSRSAPTPARPARSTARTSRSATGSGRAFLTCAPWRPSPTTPWAGTVSTASAGGCTMSSARCDPYTHRLLTGGTYHHCCPPDLARALAAETGLPLPGGRAHVHDVLNVFMCTGFWPTPAEYFMKASPCRRLSRVRCRDRPLGGSRLAPRATARPSIRRTPPSVTHCTSRVLRPEPEALASWNSPAVSTADRSHGTGTAPGRGVDLRFGRCLTARRRSGLELMMTPFAIAGVQMHLHHGDNLRPCATGCRS